MDGFNWKQIALPAAYIGLIGVIAVFAHSGLQSEHGLAAFREAGSEEKRLKADLAALQADRAALQNKVHRLSDRYLDLDLLDERARAVLGYARADELIVR
ncbi:MAG: septum formation initiator family protein [Pseudomonadota bacterium]